MLHHDVDKGWVTNEGEPRWRATSAAVDQVTGADIKWLVQPRRAHVGHLPSGKPIAVLRYYPAARRWSARIEGFAFWSYNRILRREHFKDVEGFDRVSDARRFVRTVLRQAGAQPA